MRPALLFPDGRLRSPRWRVVVATAVFGATVAPLAGSLMPGQLRETPVPIANPFALSGTAGTAASALAVTAVTLYWLSLPAALGSLVLRFRSSVGVERQQLRWVAAGAALTIVGLLAGAFVAAAGYAAVLCVPVAEGEDLQLVGRCWSSASRSRTVVLRSVATLRCNRLRQEVQQG
jgi:two-component system NarL family sensor kinase